MKLEYSYPIIFNDIIHSWIIIYGKINTHLKPKNYFSRLSPEITNKLYLYFNNILNDYYGLSIQEKELFFELK